VTDVRAAAVAGTFYPRDARELAAEIDVCLGAAVPGGEPRPKALIVPHAGYLFSGPTAGQAYARLRRFAESIERVVVVGPAHTVWIEGLAVSSCDGFATPLGVVPVDAELRRRVLALSQVKIDDRAHAGEHAIEVQLPFLQRVLRDFAILPLVAGEASPTQVAEVLDAVWGGDETLIVVSSDLSHYHDYRTARRLDTRTAAAIVARDGNAVADDDACGARPVRGLLASVCSRGLGVCLIDLCNSGDTAGDRERVVGYGSFAVA